MFDCNGGFDMPRDAQPDHSSSLWGVCCQIFQIVAVAGMVVGLWKAFEIQDRQARQDDEIRSINKKLKVLESHP
jgi:hypothetical protein